MKKSFVGSIAAVSVMILLSVNTFAGSLEDDFKKSKKNSSSNQTVTAPNGNYKHVIPTSPNNKFKDSFVKPEADITNRNYKQQNKKEGTVKFKEHFINTGKRDSRSYKHQQGL